MFDGTTISVVIPCYNEVENISEFVSQVQNLGIVDEIIVVDNNSTDGSRNAILKTNAIYLREETQGYGATLQNGIRNATGDFIVTVEPDGTFDIKDIFKFLAYKEDFDIILGTRTTRDLIWQHAYMPHWIRFGNILYAKTLQIFFSGPSLTDVGCTYKAFSSNARNLVIDKCKVKGSHFSPELMIRFLETELKVIEIPVNYKKRIGTSKITGGNVTNTFKVAFNMLVLMLVELIKKA